MIDKNSLLFDKNTFADIITQIREQYSSQEEFSEKSNIGRTYISQYMNKKLDAPPKPRVLKNLANASMGIITYEELMEICGYVHIENEFKELENGNIDFLLEGLISKEDKIHRIEELINSIEAHKKSEENRLHIIINDNKLKLLYADTTNLIKNEISLDERRLLGLRKGLEKLQKQ